MKRPRLRPPKQQEQPQQQQALQKLKLTVRPFATSSASSLASSLKGRGSVALSAGAPMTPNAAVRSQLDALTHRPLAAPSSARSLDGSGKPSSTSSTPTSTSSTPTSASSTPTSTSSTPTSTSSTPTSASSTPTSTSSTPT
eukprot:Selendium_serpulae@DN10875_c0_g1_i1.p1